MASALIGHIDCPVCAHKDAHVREDKNGHAYIFCRDGCNQQLFTRDPHRNKLLRAKMRPVSVTETVTEPPAKPEQIKTAPEPQKPAPVPTPQPATKNAPAGDSAPPAAKKKSSWFTPILAGGDD